MAQNVRDFTAKEWQAVIKSLTSKLSKEMYNDMSVTLGDKRPYTQQTRTALLGLKQSTSALKTESTIGDQLKLQFQKKQMSFIP